jgi:predicted nucleotidyltransferase
MDKGHVIQTLRAHEPELCAAGVMHLSIVGSVARDEASASSDVDLTAEFDSKRKMTLLDMVELESRLSDILKVKVDLTPAKTMKARGRVRGRSCLLGIMLLACAICRHASI